ncbi:MAG: fimbrillin family protein [Dysgonamonadaceae bacterium]|jgi:hypothetical protein|nr:fimbrillin family protein [Dysgonamonadaceae bacterium]
MTAKQFFFVLPVVAGCLYGCSKNEIIDTPASQQEISFRAQTSVPALRTTSTTLDYVNAFVVYGSDDVFGANGDLIFDGVTVARQPGSIAAFAYAPKKYYGQGATEAKFFAYSPVSKNITGFSATGDATDELSDVTFNYKVLKPLDTGNTSQEDLLVAHTIPNDVTGAVALDFKHALSRIFVKAANELNEPVTITKLTLRNLYDNGTFTFTTLSNIWSWNTIDAKTDYSYVLANTGVAVPVGTTTKTLVTSNEQGMLVLPQKTSNTNDDKIVDTGDFALEVTYDIANLIDQTAYVLLADNYEFEAGKQYAITISFTGTDLVEITFTITVTDFDSITDIP